MQLSALEKMGFVVVQRSEVESLRGLTVDEIGDWDLCARDALAATADVFNVSTKLLVEQNRTRSISRPRQIGMAVALSVPGASSAVVGKVFGGRHYSTVLNARDRISKLIEDDPECQVAVWHRQVVQSAKAIAMLRRAKCNHGR